MDKNDHSPSFWLLAGVLASATIPAISLADQDPVDNNQGWLEEVIVTARKREESVQDTPVAVTSLGADQLESAHFQNFSDIAVGLPNVALDHVATFRGAANFSIRGLGINSSIPSIDPAVGVFIDGVYMGQLGGIVLDMFDIQSIEVLRGPQGSLFGRNVTGGAVLVHTRPPTEELEASANAAIEGNPNGDGGLNRILKASVSGPLTETLDARISVYDSDDDGWFVNLANGKDFGASGTTIIRPAIRWTPRDNVDLNLRWEHLESDGDGPASQTHTNGSGVPGYFANYERDSFDFAIDQEGFIDLTNDFVSLEVNWDVAPGDGTITNIFGWRDFDSNGMSDIDSQPVWLFHAPFWNNSEQVSNELRYSGVFDRMNVTAGIYWFSQEINYHERRELLGLATGNVRPARTQDGGGDYNVDALSIFTSVDYQLSDEWSLTAGLNFTDEKKQVDIASLSRNVDKPCNVTLGTCPFDFVDDKSWSDWSGKLGATFTPSDDTMLYGHWSRAHRSGGYNLRNAAIDNVNLGPGPFDTETVDAFEVGVKWDATSRGRINAAIFQNLVDDLQREIVSADPDSGIVQIIRNAADARITGLEIETTWLLNESFTLFGSLGWMDPSYRRVFLDLNGDGVIDDRDKDLQLPRAAELTWNLGLAHDLALDSGAFLHSRVDYAYRDRSYFTDDNLGYLLSQEILDASIQFVTAEGHWAFSIYGKNLLNDVLHGGDSQLPTLLGGVAPVGGTFAPLVRGRVVGLEGTWYY